jgi:predicted S18 family serine protease
MAAKDVTPKRAIIERPPATTPEARERRLTAMAMDLAEARLASGQATSQEIVHFLKLGSSRESLEQERLRSENELSQAKIDAIASHQKIEELYAEALSAMKSYSGEHQSASDDEGDYEDVY